MLHTFIDKALVQETITSVGKKMNLSVILFLSLVLWLSAPGSVKVVGGQGQMTDTISVLQGSGNGQCSSMEARDRARSDIHQIVTSVVSSTCNVTPSSPKVGGCTPISLHVVNTLQEHVEKGK